jgi:glycosyltransferase involved in cell wall biosynthesis
VRHGHEVEVWTTRHAGDNDVPEVNTIDGVTVRRFVMPLPPAQVGPVVRFPLPALGTVRELRAAAHAFQPDLLHVQCFSVNGVYAAVLGRLLNVPLVVTLQGETYMDDHDIFEHSSSLRAALRLGLRQAAAVTGCSGHALGDAVTRFGLPPAKGHVVFNGVEPDESVPEAVDLPFERFVLALGRVVRKKGFDLLVRAFATLAEEHPDVGLVIAGRGPTLPLLERQARAFGLADRIHLPGPFTRPQVAWAMRNCELFVMPSRVEPFGIVNLEAWRAGAPLVTSAVGGAPEFVRDGVDGVIVDPRDTEALGRVIGALLGDPDRRRALGAAGAARVSEFTWDRIAQSYEAIYARVLGVSDLARATAQP